MSETAHTPVKSEQDDNGVAPKSNGPKASSKTPNNSANKKNGVNLTPVESLLFFNIVRFNKDPSNIDWDQVAKHSSLKNPSSAKVRFRQIQKKYGMDTNSASRPAKRKARAGAAEDDEECEDDEDTDESPSKKRSSDLSTRGNASQSRASRKKTVVQKKPDSEDGTPASTANHAPVSNPDMPVKQDHYEQQVEEQDEPGIKQESPVRQVQMMRPSPTHPNEPSHNYHHLQQQQQQQQQRGHEGLSLAGSGSGTYNMGDAQRSGAGMFRGMPTFHGASTMANSHQSQVLTPQQQAYLQNLQRLHHDRVTQQDPYMGYGHSEAQSHPSAYMTQQAGGQYGQYAVHPTYTKLPQAYYNPQTQSGGVQPLNRPPTMAPTRAQTQSPATSLREDKPAHSSGNGSFASAPESPIRPLFDDIAHMTDSAASPAGTSNGLTSHDDANPKSSTRQGEDN